MQENRLSNDPYSQINLVYAKTSPGSYCHHTYYQQTNVVDWNPEPINGILIQEGKQLLSLKLALQFIVNINIAIIHFNFKFVMWHAALISCFVTHSNGRMRNERVIGIYNKARKAALSNPEYLNVQCNLSLLYFTISISNVLN